MALSDEEWLEMTPRQLHALRQQQWKRQLAWFQRLNLLFGMLASTSANFSFCHPEKPIPPTAFMLYPLDDQPRQEQPLTGESLMAMVHTLPKQAFVSKE